MENEPFEPEPRPEDMGIDELIHAMAFFTGLLQRLQHAYLQKRSMMDRELNEVLMEAYDIVNGENPRGT